MSSAQAWSMTILDSWSWVVESGHNSHWYAIESTCYHQILYWCIGHSPGQNVSCPWYENWEEFHFLLWPIVLLTRMCRVFCPSMKHVHSRHLIVSRGVRAQFSLVRYREHLLPSNIVLVHRPFARPKRKLSLVWELGRISFSPLDDRFVHKNVPCLLPKHKAWPFSTRESWSRGTILTGTALVSAYRPCARPKRKLSLVYPVSAGMLSIERCKIFKSSCLSSHIMLLRLCYMRYS